MWLWVLGSVSFGETCMVLGRFAEEQVSQALGSL